MIKQCYAKYIGMFLAVLMLFSLFGPLMVNASYSSDLDRLEEEKQTIQNNKAEAGNKVSALREQKAAWIEQKTALDERNRLAQEEILNTQKQIAIYNEMIAEKQAEAEAAQAAANETLEQYKKRLRSMEENGQMNTYVAVFMGASDFGEILSRVDMMTEIMDHDKRIEQSYKDARDFALDVKEEYEQLNLELEAKKGQLEEEVTQLEHEIVLHSLMQKALSPVTAMQTSILQQKLQEQKLQ